LLFQKYDHMPIQISYEDFTYDDEGRISQIDSSQGTIGYGYYTTTGRKMLVRSPAVGDLNVITDHIAATSQTSYTYDEMGRLKTVSVDRRDGSTTGLPEVTTYNLYDANGNRDEVLLPNNVKTKYTYDELNRLTLLTQDTGSNLATYSYTLGNDGRRNTITDAILPVMGTQDFYTRVHQYDNLNRLTQEDSSEDGTGTNGYVADYTYDLVGNRTERVLVIKKVGQSDRTVTTSYLYDDKDRLLNESNVVVVAGVPKNSYPVYVADGGSGGDRDIYKVVWMTNPSRWWGPMLYSVFALAGLCLVALPLWTVITRRSKKPLQSAYAAFKRGISYLLVLIFLIGPGSLQVMADNANLYDNLSETDWTGGSTGIVYDYDANGSVIQKTVTGSDDHELFYAYDYRNRLQDLTETRWQDVDADPQLDKLETVTAYVYNSSGIRISSETWSEIDDVDQGDHETTLYLIDPTNHTGYAQVLDEAVYNKTAPDPLVDTPVSTTTYTLGDDIISQSKDGVVRHLLYDGHGSTRQLSDTNGIIKDIYSYDAYGVMLGGNPTPSNPATTNYLYAGEQWDNHAQHSYNRARYYNPYNGRFNRVDPFSGISSDPQSLHKYLYAHANPVNMTDPSGLFTFGGLGIAIAIGAIIGAIIDLTPFYVPALIREFSTCPVVQGWS